jgi:hypothetical protein
MQRKYIIGVGGMGIHLNKITEVMLTIKNHMAVFQQMRQSFLRIILERSFTIAKVIKSIKQEEIPRKLGISKTKFSFHPSNGGLMKIKSY